jgi:acetylglutamate kinase
MDRGMDTAKILIESLPYIKEFYHKTVVIKYGGHAMVDEELKKNFALDIILMKYIGINPVIVHGGGPQINRFLDKMQIKSNYVQGMRVTDGETMDVVEMVLVGKVNTEIVSLINLHGGKAVGLSGRDGDLIKATKMEILKSQVEDAPPELIDLGRVGKVTAVNPDVLETLDRQDFIPVIAPVGVGSDGQSFNINADLVAGAIASQLKAEKLILLTDVIGVLDQSKKLVPTLTRKQADKMIASGDIAGGMIPKIKCCLDSVSQGVKKAHIIDGRVEHAVLLEMFTKNGVGTEIV